jgi:hypothetical protein
MTCAEFQKVLPYIIDGGGSAEEQKHLETCAICSELVSDLRYIAQQAKLLVPMLEPDKKVWNGIKKTLQKEGHVKNAGSPERLLGGIFRPRWGPSKWLVPFTFLALAAVSYAAFS